MIIILYLLAYAYKFANLYSNRVFSFFNLNLSALILVTLVFSIKEAQEPYLFTKIN
jgi:hypothetical protein